MPQLAAGRKEKRQGIEDYVKSFGKEEEGMTLTCWTNNLGPEPFARGKKTYGMLC